MPHRVVLATGLVKFAVGSVGAVTSAWGLWMMAAVDPDHLRLLMVASAGACLWLIRAAFKDFQTVWTPGYINYRKQMKQMELDMLEMDRKSRESERRSQESEAKLEAKVGDVKTLVQDNSALIAQLERELVEAHAQTDQFREKVASAEKYNRERRHVIDGEVQAQKGQIFMLQHDLSEAYRKIDRLKAKLGITDKTHADAINTVSDSVEILAVHMDPPLPSPIHLPHVEPVPSDPNGSDVVAAPGIRSPVNPTSPKSPPGAAP